MFDAFLLLHVQKTAKTRAPETHPDDGANERGDYELEVRNDV